MELIVVVLLAMVGAAILGVILFGPLFYALSRVRQDLPAEAQKRSVRHVRLLLLIWPSSVYVYLATGTDGSARELLSTLILVIGALLLLLPVLTIGLLLGRLVTSRLSGPGPRRGDAPRP